MCEKVREGVKHGNGMTCVDLQKVYDKVDREELRQVLEEYGVKGSLLRAVRPCIGEVRLVSE